MAEFLKVDLGEFQNISGEMVMSDPCYEKGIWCAALLKNVMRGTWRVEAIKSDDGEWGVRVAVLRAIHESYSGEYFDLGPELGVDSGQLGIYDASHYHDDSVFSEPSKFGACGKDEWYGHNCDITLDAPQAGIIPYGCVSCSGYGDGSYGSYAAYNVAGHIVGIEVVFIDEEDEDDESVVS